MVYGSARFESNPVLSLADFVRRTRLEKNLSLQDVSVRSRRQIGKTHINRIENGRVSRVSLSKLRALSLGLAVSVDEILAAAQGNSSDAGASTNEATLLNYFRQLSTDQQKDLLTIVRALAERIND
jgi:transcriptional regulator with XRE-family HTH domain